MTRLKSLHVKDFRSIDGEVRISLDAPIVLIHGPNGAGKTSLLSAIELALTGQVTSLSRAEPEYLNYLPHIGKSHGEVRLEVEGIAGATRRCELKVTPGAVLGNPLLGGSDAAFFCERSYLAQSTLGRLLEIYQHAEKKSESPLTRFIKELLGLDRMEALISGLHSAGNITRLKGPVPDYGQSRDEISKQERSLEEHRRRLKEAVFNLETCKRELTERLIVIDSRLTERQADLPALVLALEHDSEGAALLALVEADRELQVSRASFNSTVDYSDSNRAQIEEDNRASRAKFEEWTRQHGEAIETLLVRAATQFADVSMSSESNYVERGIVLASRIDADRRRIQNLLSADATVRAQREMLARELDEARTRLARVDAEIAIGTEHSESLAASLSALSTHLHDDRCPVCDRDYSEVSTTPLAAHLSAKVAAMIEQTGRMRALFESQKQNRIDLTRLERNLATTATELQEEAELNRLKERVADLGEIYQQLQARNPEMREGDTLRDEAARTAHAVARLQNADQTTVILRRSLLGLAERFNVPADAVTPTETLLQAIGSMLEQRKALLARRQSDRKAALESLSKLIASSNEVANLGQGIETLASSLADLQITKLEADRIIEMGKELAKQTREARAQVVRRVFNDELNTLWRDLFIRLAPEEPFIPAFSIPETTGADIEAALETHHRRGGKAGNPRAMLSAGNLNTAALTLFLALHLSVKARLPWLVIDDPVQSMDEVHIAQFAALLRTLSKQMGRQVIIAVHERSLFDYLSLELSPAFEGDRLNIIELGRNAIGQTTHRWDAKIFTPDRAIAA